MMRDAQVEAIKTYLFLKIECRNKPLWKLFSKSISWHQENDTSIQKVTAKIGFIYQFNADKT
jgi:hypothetical protein